MKILKEYRINPRTVLIYEEKNFKNKYCTRVIEEDRTFLVKMSPLELINSTMLRRGSNLRGALRSSKFLLGPSTYFPLSVDKFNGIFLFSIKAKKTIWFSLKHVLKATPKGMNKTEVTLSLGQSVLLDVEESIFQQKLSKAEELRKIIIKNSHAPLIFYLEGIKKNS